MASTTATETRANSVTPSPQGEGGFDECWYPVALSAEVARDAVHGTEFLDGRVVVHRGVDGRPQVLSAYCRHLGADLGDGDVVDGCVRCPFHHWRYATSGKCVGTSVGDRVTSDTALFAFPTEERWGLIWAFNGTAPSYDVPSWPESESERHHSAILAADYRGDPFLATLNVIDVQHLRSLHGLDVSDVELQADGNSFHVDMTIGGGEMALPNMTRHAQIIGTNAVVYSGTSTGIDTLAGATPYGPGRSRLYLVTAGLRSRLPADAIVAAVDERQEQSRDVLVQDLPILDRIRFRADKVTASDRGVVTFLKFAVTFPRSHVSAPYIT